MNESSSGVDTPAETKQVPSADSPSDAASSGGRTTVVEIWLTRRRVRFGLGQVLATPGALALLDTRCVSALALLSRHASGDWGDTCAEDRETNEAALVNGARLMSVYRLVDAERLAKVPAARRSELPTVWVITEAVDDDGFRRSTTLLLPSEA